MSTGAGADCSGGTSFFVTNGDGTRVRYDISGDGAIAQNGVDLTDPIGVTISSLLFYASGTARGDAFQPHVTIIVSGTVSYAAGKTEPFTIETGATMRGSDI